METSFRDNAIAKNKRLLQITLAWALSSSFAVILLSMLSGYALLHKEVHWLPVCSDAEFSIGDKSYSPSYLKEMTKKIIDLRLTYNPETIASRYETLLHSIPIARQEVFKKKLDAEIDTVTRKNISSVFYGEQVAVDMKLQQGRIQGLLARTSHGLAIKPVKKTYVVQFSFKNGLLWPESVKEMS